MFICHSLGGIVFKKALLLANESREQNQHLVHDSCRVGVVFIGTPHVGSEVDGERSRELLNLVSAFAGQAGRLKFVVSMYEAEQEVGGIPFPRSNQLCLMENVMDSDSHLERSTMRS